MKNYIIDGKGEEKYIRNVIKNPNGTMTIVFADGRVFKNISYSEDNLEKIIATEEAQADMGINNYRTFEGKKIFSKALTFISGIGVMGAAIGATYIPQINEALIGQSPIVVAAGVGVITILGTLPAYTKYCIDKSILKELDKLRYRKMHLSELKNFRDYPNALSGVNPRTARFMISAEDPFSILNIDEYNIEDLEKMITNINVEKEYNFTYRKANTRHS